ncbi:MAG: helix-turn-helix domain-containing protein [Candidatus Thalassarchaeaceae archaeon]
MVNDNTKSNLAAWMQQVMNENNWTAAEWARRAGVTATNITRFMRSQKHMPSGHTIAALAGCVQLPPPLGKKRLRMEGRTVPVSRGGRSVAEIVELASKSDDKVVTLVPVGVDALAVEIETDRYSMGGILPGDVAIFEPMHVRDPNIGNIVAFLGGSGVEIGRYSPPLLLPHSTNPLHDPVKISDIDVLGVVVEVIRRFV